MPQVLTSTIGQELVDLAKTKVGNSYLLGAIAPKDDPFYKGPWDCAEFASWLVFQTTGRLYGCQNNESHPKRADAFTGFFKRDADTIGHKISVEQAAGTPGAFLLRVATPGLIGHIVVSDGLGGTVEAHSRKTGVINGKISGRRWDFGILIPWVNYDEINKHAVNGPAVSVFRVKTPLIKSEEVKKIQAALDAAGFDPRGIDGVYGLNTAKAVSAFQEKHDLVVDGEVGLETAKALGIESIFA